MLFAQVKNDEILIFVDEILNYWKLLVNLNTRVVPLLSQEMAVFLMSITK